MRNPLFKRLPKELLKDLAKYIVMFFFLALPIALCAGYMIGNNSMIISYEEGLTRKILEDGHFKTSNEIDNNLIEEIEKEENISIYSLYYKDEAYNASTIRIYKMSDRENINKWDILKGNNPVNDNEIALDRLYCENNKLNIGDKINISNKEFVISGTVALVDYSTMYKNNTDTMFNATSFSIALVNDNSFNLFDNGNLVYNYAYLFPNRLETNEAHERNVELTKSLYQKLLMNGNTLNELLAAEDNQAIQFAIDDIEGDMTLMLVFGFIIVFGLAFVFALSIKSQIESEAKCIGTLKAMGYKYSELTVSFLVLPTIITLLSAILGNILAYTFLKDYIVSLYYHSYSLAPYTTYYNMDALIYTTLIPLVLVFIINLLTIIRVIKMPTLNLLKNQLMIRKKKKVVKLSSKIKFIPRFQLRVILQNKGTYIALFFGTFLATTILLFGLMMDPLLKHYKEEVLKSQIAPIQTILKVDLDLDEGEKLYVKTLNYENDEVMVYGLEKYGDTSKYLSNLKIDDKSKVVVASGLSSKYGVKNGSLITLKETYSDTTYKLNVSASYNTTGTLVIFMDINTFKETFSDGYLASYFSDEALNISNELIYKTITTEDLLITSNQLTDSMGRVFVLFTAISIILFVLLIYLLAKIVIEKNQSQISMLKIVGYKTSDINKIYNAATGIMTIISVVISTFLAQFFIKIAWNIVLKTRMKGWLDFYVAPYLYPIIFGIGVLSFLLVYLIESRRISKINLALALKDDTL